MDATRDLVVARMGLDPLEESGWDQPAFVADVAISGDRIAAIGTDLGDAHRPASLSRAVVEHAATLPGSPVVLSDDLEMGALGGFGDLPDLVVAALTARSHGVLVCKGRLER